MKNKNYKDIIVKIISMNYETIVKAIYEHHKKYMFSSSRDLCMYFDDAYNFKLLSEAGSNSNKVWQTDHLVIYRCGGNVPIWYHIGNVFRYLEDDGLLDIIYEISNTQISNAVVEKYVEENHPDWVNKWIEEYHDYHYDDEYDAAESILEDFIDCIDDIDFDDEEEE